MGICIVESRRGRGRAGVKMRGSLLVGNVNRYKKTYVLRIVKQSKDNGVIQYKVLAPVMIDGVYAFMYEKEDNVYRVHGDLYETTHKSMAGKVAERIAEELSKNKQEKVLWVEIK